MIDAAGVPTRVAGGTYRFTETWPKSTSSRLMNACFARAFGHRPAQSSRRRKRTQRVLHRALLIASSRLQTGVCPVAASGRYVLAVVNVFAALGDIASHVEAGRISERYPTLRGTRKYFADGRLYVASKTGDRARRDASLLDRLAANSERVPLTVSQSGGLRISPRPAAH